MPLASAGLFLFFTFRSFLYNFTLDNSIHVSSTWRVGKSKFSEVCQKHWIYFKTTRTILCPYLYVTPAQIECLSLYINQALLLNSFFKISIFNSCYPRSKVCMILESPPHPLLIFFFWVISFKLPIAQTFFLPRRFKLSGVDRSSIVFFQQFFMNDKRKQQEQI